MQEENSTSHTSLFDAIRKVDDEGREYWSARDLARLLDYTQWRNFTYAIKKAQVACEKSGENPANHFAASSKMVACSGSQRQVPRLSNVTVCLLLVSPNADPEKEIVSLGQTYFAVQTRRQELSDEEALADLQRTNVAFSFVAI